MRIRVIVLDEKRPSGVALYWRPLGKGQYHRIEMRSIGRAVYDAKLPPASASFEYYAAADIPGGKLVWPAVAPKMSQTVVVW